MLDKSHFYIIGIKGAAMVHIAAMLKEMGKTVSGADVDEEFPTDIVLQDNGIVSEPFEKAQLPSNTEVVIYSAGHGGKNNPLVQEALQKGIEVYHQAEVLGEIITKYDISLAVAGCHGKTTTSSLLSFALLKLGKDPSYMIGAPSFNEYQGSHIGGQEYFVIEADEYALHPPEDKTPKFHKLKPTNAIITNIDFDHPDVFANLEETKKAFKVFMEQVSSTNDAESLIVCADDENLMAVVTKIPDKSIATYGLSEKAEYRVKNIRYSNKDTAFSIFFEDEFIGKYTIKLSGEKNVLNAAGVITLLLQLGFDPAEIQSAIADFTGAKRRFEHVGNVNGVDVFDDYAHHPNELKAVLEAAKSRYPGRTLHIIFQPHTFTRTEMLAHEFIQALAIADDAIILPIFASAREVEGNSLFTNATLAKLAVESGVSTVTAAPDNDNAVEVLKEHIKGNDIVIMAGAGDVYKLTPAILSMLEK